MDRPSFVERSLPPWPAWPTFAVACRARVSPAYPNPTCHAAATTACDPTPALDLACVGALLGGNGVCKKAAGRGATCGGSGIPPCSLSLQCAMPDGGDLGTCQDAPSEGQPCFASTCRAPAVCYTGTMTCVVPPTSARYGSRCHSDLDCASLSCALGGSEDSMRCVHAATPVFCMGAGVNPAAPNNPPPSAP